MGIKDNNPICHAVKYMFEGYGQVFQQLKPENPECKKKTDKGKRKRIQVEILGTITGDVNQVDDIGNNAGD
jgi:hypothetical protein